MRKGHNRKAIERLQLSLKHDETTVDEEREILQLLCELYFKENSFSDCLHTGRRLKDSYKGQKDEVIIQPGFYSVSYVLTFGHAYNRYAHTHGLGNSLL